MENKKEPLKVVSNLEKAASILCAIAAVGLLVLYLFFTQEQAGQGDPLYPLFIIFLCCGFIAAILPFFGWVYKKIQKKKE